ncbi:MAG: sodium:proton antiporter NhaD [Proteobacteria bacterium]|jgi:NhaD family Na+/H+ antiporter|nr:sodium:proton antiporter NhaD [Pseudomonadota bacterium]
MRASRLIPGPRLLLVLLVLLPPVGVYAAAESALTFNLTFSGYGIAALAVFIFAYALVISEEFLHLRKSKPVIVAAGIIWILVGLAFYQHGDVHTAADALRRDLREFAELMLFLLAAMTYINTMEERQVFNALRSWLVRRGFSLRGVYWITGLLAFLISPIADNLTTALLMAAVVMAVASENRAFITLASINIVVAANAGGAFSPFGDITTLMVWQKGVVRFEEFFDLFIPSLVNWLVPALLMYLAVPAGMPHQNNETVHIKKGGLVVIGLFLFTITLTVTLHNTLHLPPVLGMMTGLGLLKFFGYYLKQHELNHRPPPDSVAGPNLTDLTAQDTVPKRPFDIFEQLARAEWDTLMFFYGVVMCVGGLGALGYLTHASEIMYTDLGPTTTNVLVGMMSSIVDNIPIMFAVLSMNPDMSHGQWLLVTLTAGVGGSLLSIGSAAGVALMGQTRGRYTFFGHLRWSWAVGLGYALSIWTHFLINSDLI